MRSPHRIGTRPDREPPRPAAPSGPGRRTAPAPDRRIAPDRPTTPAPRATPAPASGEGRPRYRNPYDELGALADDPYPCDDLLKEAPDEGGTRPIPVVDEPWEPPNHRRGGRRQRRRRRRLPGSRAAKAVVALLVLAAFLGLGDRWAVLYAEHRAAGALKDQLRLTAAPEVSIGGFPFLTQLARRRLDDVTVTVPDVGASRVTLAQVTARARDVRIDGQGLTGFTGLRVADLHGRVLLSFADMNRELGASQVTFSRLGNDRVLARGTLPVAGQDLRVRADASIRRLGTTGIATEIGGMRLDIGDLATYRPGTRPSEGLHLTPASIDRITAEAAKARQLLAVPAIVERVGVPQSAVKRALRDDTELSRMTGSPRFVHRLMGMNLVDVATAHPELLSVLGIDPALLQGLSRLTRPELADRLSLAFRLPGLPGGASGSVRLRDVSVRPDGIRVDLTGQGLAFGER
ncbi:DUF2993 domain-containing protein [Streptomyces sp. LP05-1]|uniref:DUF2993 domain-containing protein n=1 Tax=Streptomyces pyxinae TaxID=2970734 RepID=A0ABT2CL67_9ACTN|nr:DUF2993 domain-containing protein [Streptomyces sp. LP05-1]MCS0638055.1 DUF2993 domain-containing protein [Streptomyces sp. LP05-1]